MQQRAAVADKITIVIIKLLKEQFCSCSQLVN